MRRFVVPLLLAVSVPAVAAPLGPPPPTPRRPVEETLHGVTFRDDYRWLEDGNDPSVRAWSEAQNRRARAYLDALPDAPAIRRRLEAIVAASSPSWTALAEVAGRLFALETQPGRQQPVLVVMGADADPARARVVVDPNVLDAAGTTAIDFFVPSLDGKQVAVSLSSRGSEAGDVHVFDVDSGRERVGDAVARVNGGTAGGSLAWTRDGFFYTRYPRTGERPAADLGFWQQVWFHRLGTPTKSDVYAVGKTFPRIAETTLRGRRDGAWQLALVEDGDGPEYALWLHGPDGKWRALAGFADGIVEARFGEHDDLYLLSRKGAPRGRVLRLVLSDIAAGKGLVAATVAVPEGDGAIDDFAAAKRGLFVVETVGGPSRLRFLSPDGNETVLVDPRQVAAVDGLVATDAGDVYWRVQDARTPPAWWRADSLVRRTPLVVKAPVDLSGIFVDRDEAVSRDGTRVPFTLLHRNKLPLDGDTPTLLTGYGGFDISLRPKYDPMLSVLLDAGVAVAIANLRGGGELGEDWHRAGMGVHKQNVFDDFVAVARRIVDVRVTRPARLAVEGGSNGGLLVGAAITQHPELFKAAVALVGYFDMLRFETAPNGAFNAAEYGSVADEASFRALAAYSPYQHVKDGTAYPATLLATGANDPRVDPMHSRKMLARLQAAEKGDAPILLRTSATTGHGIGSPLAARIDLLVDVDAFVLDQLGVRLR